MRLCEVREVRPGVAAAVRDFVAAQARGDGVFFEELLARVLVAARQRHAELRQRLGVRFLVVGERGFRAVVFRRSFQNL